MQTLKTAFYNKSTEISAQHIALVNELHFKQKTTKNKNY